MHLRLPHRYAVKTDPPCTFPSSNKIIEGNMQGGSDVCFIAAYL